MITDPFDLQRFLDAQAPIYPVVLGELRSGSKQSHWMWFIFSQLAGLGQSAMAQRFAISSRDEAVAYLSHNVLGYRLFEVRFRKPLALGLSAGWFAMAAVLYPAFIQSALGESAKAADSISPDCSAFKKEIDGKWIATKHSEITGSVSGPEPIYPGLNLEMMRPNGLNLVAALNQKCKTAKPPS